MWEGRENRPCPGTGQAVSRGFHVHLRQEHLFSSPENTSGATISLGGGRSRAGLAGTGVSWYTSWAFSRTFLGPQVTVTGTRLRGFHCRSYQRASGRTPPAPASFWLRPTWDFFLGPLGLRAGRCTGAGKGEPSQGSGESGPQLTLSLGTLVATQPGCGLQVSQNIAGGGAGPRLGLWGPSCAPK